MTIYSVFKNILDPKIDNLKYLNWPLEAQTLFLVVLIS
jgi:hypothetical protein